MADCIICEGKDNSFTKEESYHIVGWQKVFVGLFLSTIKKKIFIAFYFVYFAHQSHTVRIVHRMSRTFFHKDVTLFYLFGQIMG